MKSLLISLLNIIKSLLNLRDSTFKIDFKTSKIQDEWQELKKRNFKLAAIVQDIAYFVKTKFDKDIVLTSIFRARQSEDLASVDNYWRGVDIRSRTFNMDEIEQIVWYINTRYSYDKDRPYLVVAMHHEVGLGLHFHIQNHPKTERI